ncbi:MAG TPA: hypothetical protein VFA20_04950 [Myxococcaceae bacterium]|nr:hypothetical protein [Myxococcaceae bacterium]
MRRLLALVACAAAAAACDGGCLGGYGSAPVQGNSGVFTVATVGTTQKLFLPMADALPNGNAWLAVVDPEVAGNGAAGAPAQRSAIDLGCPGSPSTVGADGTWAVAASTLDRNVWIIDAASEELITRVVLDDSFGVSGFSGGGGYVTGVAVDGAHRQAILAVWNGFALMELPSGKITGVIEAPPSENFGFDAFRGRVIAPFYECATAALNGAPPAFCGDYEADGLNVIDLTTEAVFRYRDTSARDPKSPVGGEPDSATVDLSSGTAVVSSELGGFESVIELGQASFSTTANTAGTLTATRHEVSGLGFTGIAIPPDGSRAFFEEEFSPDVAVVGLSAALQGNARARIGLLPDAPGAVPWENAGDPHGIGAMALGGKPFGLVVNRQRSWIARVDLTKMEALPANGGIIQTADMASAVTFLDPRTPP